MDLQTMRQEIEAELVNRAASDQNFRAELIANPKKTISEAFGLQFSQNLEVIVHEESPDELHLVLPVQLNLNEGDLSDQHLEAVVGGVGESYTISSSALNLSIQNPSSSISFTPGTLDASGISMAVPAGMTTYSDVPPPIALYTSSSDPNALMNTSNQTIMGGGKFSNVTPKGVTTNSGSPSSGLQQQFASPPAGSSSK